MFSIGTCFWSGMLKTLLFCSSAHCDWILSFRSLVVDPVSSDPMVRTNCHTHLFQIPNYLKFIFCTIKTLHLLVRSNLDFNKNYTNNKDVWHLKYSFRYCVCLRYRYSNIIRVFVGGTFHIICVVFPWLPFMLRSQLVVQGYWALASGLGLLKAYPVVIGCWGPSQ